MDRRDFIKTSAALSLIPPLGGVRRPASKSDYVLIKTKHKDIKFKLFDAFSIYLSTTSSYKYLEFYSKEDEKLIEIKECLSDPSNFIAMTYFGNDCFLGIGESANLRAVNESDDAEGLAQANGLNFEFVGKEKIKSTVFNNSNSPIKYELVGYTFYYGNHHSELNIHMRGGRYADKYFISDLPLVMEVVGTGNILQLKNMVYRPIPCIIDSNLCSIYLQSAKHLEQML